MKPVTGTGSGTAHDPRMVRLQEVLEKVNDLFAGEDFTPAEQQSWVEGIVKLLMDDETIGTQATANTKAQFVESPDLEKRRHRSSARQPSGPQQMAGYFFNDDHIKVEFIKLLGAFMHENIHALVG